MEKQPIDELVSRKLRDAEITPSATAWIALQDKLGNKRVVPIWTYVSIAASLILTGSFGWWIMTAQDSATYKTATAKTAIAPEKSSINRKEQPLADVGKKPEKGQLKVQASSVEQAQTRLVQQNSIIANIDKSATGKSERQRTTTQVSQESVAQVIDDTENRQTQPTTQVGLAEKTPVPVTTAAATLTSLNSERTLIVSIEVPVKTITTANEMVKPTESLGSRTGFGNLFNKVKRFKEGEVFAQNTPKSLKNNRRGLGKLYADVKESIQNNSAD